jgi:uncharacterized protein YbaP (TraB family)
MIRTKRSFIKVFTLLAVGVATLGASAKSTLWKITSGEAVMYVQGSVHVLSADCYPLAPAIEQAYSSSTALALEVDMAEMMSPKTQQLIKGKKMLKQPDTLNTVLEPETYESLKTACEAAGLPMIAIERFKPWFATQMLSLVKLQSLGQDAQYGLDKYFFDQATADKKSVIGLETVGFQIALFDELAEDNPNDFVKRSLADLKLLEENMTKMLAAWKTGDSDALHDLINKSFEGYPELYDKFNTARNKAWAKKLVKLMKDDETYMVVVGAGHLPGEKGLINLLKNKGFKAEQL